MLSKVRSESHKIKASPQSALYETSRRFNRLLIGVPKMKKRRVRKIEPVFTNPYDRDKCKFQKNEKRAKI